MTRITERLISIAVLSALYFPSFGQYRTDAVQPSATADTSTVVITLDDALKIALSENVAVKVADKEIERSEYAKKGTYSSLFPQVNGSGSYQRTIKKQIMYMDSDSGDDEEGGGFGMLSSLAPYFIRINELSAIQGLPLIVPGESESTSSNSGFAVGRWNTYNYGVSAQMPLVNAQLWESLKISGQAVDLAVEKARSSRLDMVTQVKQAFYAVLLAKEAFNVYKDVYENAVENFAQTEKRFKAEKASELEYTRAKSVVANAIPNVYNAESSIILALWQLKAVMGVDLERNIDVAGALGDYSTQMFKDIHDNDDPSLEYNTNLRQLEIQADQLASSVRMYKASYLPTLSAAFAYNMIAMTNDFKFSEYKWSPYSYVGLSLNIPIFTGGKRHFDVQQAKIQATELDLQRIDAERQLRIAIRQYLNTMETSMNSYNSASEAVGLAQKAYDIAAKSYKVGKSTITDMNDAQLTLTQASLQQSQAIYNFIVAKSNLEKTLGYDFIDDKGEVDLENM
ncbi:MAG: TolC family protein [Bacteroidales bacterium]|nr:TolC family protein [Bacteroidales bacterium]